MVPNSLLYIRDISIYVVVDAASKMAMVDISFVVDDVSDVTVGKG